MEAAQIKGGTLDSISLCGFERLEDHSLWCWGGPEQPSGTENCPHTGPNGEQICMIDDIDIKGSYHYC